MKKMNKNRLLSGSLLLLLAVFASCYEYNEVERTEVKGSTVPLTIYLQSAAHQYSTRAYEGDVPEVAGSGEDVIHDAKIWLYDATTKAFLAYGEAAEGETDEIAVKLYVPQYIISSQHKIDVYAIGNAASAGLSALDEASGSTIATLTANMLGGTNFIPGSNPTRQVPTNGLPMSCIEEDYDILNADKSDIAETLPTILMTRAVSKVRFAFARTTGYDDVAITGIEIDGGIIPAQEYIFPIAKSVNADNYATIEGKGTYRGDRYPNIVGTGDGAYLTDKIIYRAYQDEDFTTPMISSLDIHDFADPTINIWPATEVNGGTPMTAQQYSSYVTEIINNKYNYTTYLRETGKPVTGVIRYTVGGVLKSSTFAMTTANDFARNHEWIVYAYFNPATLELTVTVQPWELVEKEMDYQNNVTVVQSLNGHWTNYNATQSDLEHQSLVLQSAGDDRTLVGTFELGTPRGFSWIATFNTIAGSTTAFKFLDADDNPVSSISGAIGEGVSTLRIVASDPNATADSEAELQIVVYIEGRYRPVTELAGWHITQRRVN